MKWKKKEKRNGKVQKEAKRGNMKHKNRWSGGVKGQKMGM